MKDREKTRRQLMNTLVDLHRTLDELQESISEFQKSEERMQEKIIKYKNYLPSVDLVLMLHMR
jgi:hypothetical protein